MSQRFHIQLSPEAEKLVADLQTLPQRALVAIASAMDQENQYCLGEIKSQRLDGRGPFPVEDHRLGRRTGLLRGSANASLSQVKDQTVSSGIGSNVIYAAIHEFGGRIEKPARTVTTRLRTDSRGALLRQPGRAGAIFAKAKHKNVRTVTSEAKAHVIDMPARAPFMTGIREHGPAYGKAITLAIINAISNGSEGGKQ